MQINPNYIIYIHDDSFWPLVESFTVNRMCLIHGSTFDYLQSLENRFSHLNARKNYISWISVYLWEKSSYTSVQIIVRSYSCLASK